MKMNKTRLSRGQQQHKQESLNDMLLSQRSPLQSAAPSLVSSDIRFPDISCASANTMSFGLSYLGDMWNTIEDPTQHLLDSLVSTQPLHIERRAIKQEKSLDELDLCDFESLEPLPFASDEHAFSSLESVDELFYPTAIVSNVPSQC